MRMTSNIGTIISFPAMYIKISSIIFDYILPISFFRLSDCQKADKPFPKIKETSLFQIFSNNTTVSTWLDCSRWMSNIRKTIEKSARSFSEICLRLFPPQNIHFLDCERSRKQVDVLVPTIYKQPHIFSNRLDTSL